MAEKLIGTTVRAPAYNISNWFSTNNPNPNPNQSRNNLSSSASNSDRRDRNQDHNNVVINDHNRNNLTTTKKGQNDVWVNIKRGLLVNLEISSELETKIGEITKQILINNKSSSPEEGTIRLCSCGGAKAQIRWLNPFLPSSSLSIKNPNSSSDHALPWPTDGVSTLWPATLQLSSPKTILPFITSPFPHSNRFKPSPPNSHCFQPIHALLGAINGVSGPSTGVKREYTPEEKEAEAAAIGYKVVGPLERSDRVFKPYEPVFAVVEIGSHQFKVSNGDCIFTERLKFCDINEKIILNKVLMLGSSTQTIIGRPIVPDANVHAIVEEHALDAKVLIFKKKRRKNYRRTKGHRQELTKLRIIDVQGIEKPEIIEEPKTPKPPGKKQEKVAVTA
uniref:Large ribosomal subunit protein bL21m n=1 Tax=Cannabis sativa TaxID=3483 RepID=A0A803QDD0_CANSA